MRRAIAIGITLASLGVLPSCCPDPGEIAIRSERGAIQVAFLACNPRSKVSTIQLVRSRGDLASGSGGEVLASAEPLRVRLRSGFDLWRATLPTPGRLIRTVRYAVTVDVAAGIDQFIRVPGGRDGDGLWRTWDGRMRFRPFLKFASNGCNEGLGPLATLALAVTIAGIVLLWWAALRPRPSASKRYRAGDPIPPRPDLRR